METSIPTKNVLQHSLEPDVRHVYILARPIKMAGVLSKVSHGKFPVCHWGLLLGNMKTFYAEESSFDRLALDTPSEWGTLFELYRDPVMNTNTPNVVYGFGHSELRDEWKFLSLRKVGTTALQDNQIYEHGTSPTLSTLMRNVY